MVSSLKKTCIDTLLSNDLIEKEEQWIKDILELEGYHLFERIKNGMGNLPNPPFYAKIEELELDTTDIIFWPDMPRAYTLVIPSRSCDAIFDITAVGEGIEYIELDIGGTKIGSFTETDEDGVWRFKHFSGNPLQALPLIALRNEVRIRCLSEKCRFYYKACYFHLPFGERIVKSPIIYKFDDDDSNTQYEFKGGFGRFKRSFQDFYIML